MDCRLQARMKEMVEELAREHHEELAAAGTLVDLETLTCQIGDEFTRLLTEKELVRRGEERGGGGACCPDCQRECLPDHEPEPTVLKGLRGEVAFAQVKYFCDRCRRSFFPLAAQLGLAPRSVVTTKVLQKAIWAGANNGSYPLAVAALEQLAEIRLSPKQIRRMVSQVGGARLAEREVAVEQLQRMPLPKRREGSGASEPPELAVISMDGGRYQRRDNFLREEKGEARAKHWRETKVGCLLSMKSEVHACDPSPRFPPWLATSTAVAELAKIAEKSLSSGPPRDCEEGTWPAGEQLLYEPPKLATREVVASSSEAERFGWELEARAWQLGFPAARRQAFVADGLTVNWIIARRHFPKAEPILDLMHALSYAWSAAADLEGNPYRQWAEWIWQGKIDCVISALAEHQQHLGPPPENVEASDPRYRVARALTYYANNRGRMNYPQYRRLGLPLTSSHIESTIKQMNHRVKGSKKFWCRQTGEAVLQLRADSLSDSRPLAAFWNRWQSQQTGANRYQTAA